MYLVNMLSHSIGCNLFLRITLDTLRKDLTNKVFIFWFILVIMVTQIYVGNIPAVDELSISNAHK